MGGPSPQTTIRNREMFALRSKGASLAELAERYGVTVQAVSHALKTYRERMPEESKEDMRKDLTEFYREQMYRMMTIAEKGPIPAYSNGRPIIDENDEMVQDYSGVAKSVDLAIKISGELRKMLGLDDATKIDTSGKIVHEIVGFTPEQIADLT